MHVVGHEHVGVDGAAVLLGVQRQPMQIELVVLLRIEASRAVVAALHDVQWDINEV